ncbi:spermatogenesis associated 6-like protein isoform X1 [Antechinus flavipes]|uniref:spermatogenesis associated 6-like protein isoform X1 n=1 Tax=Antechinus flavipes TaxID=38775 RepID=UPI0022359ED1|nr:spermatogenesis associated 6-like protein isoform X1 [Antechinus flavipes]
MPLEVVVELHIRAITCPGVFLPEKKGLVLSVCILDQYRETKCFPALFPIMIHEIMKFDKVFINALDPAAVAELLETYLIRFELIQLIPPEGTLLAYYEENTRDFLFPERRLTPLYPGVDREVLMKTPLGFPGISPKIEFSTRTAIKELTPLKRFFEERLRLLRPASASYCQRVYSPQYQDLRAMMKENTCEKLSKSLRSRSPSPHTIRRLCQEERSGHPNPTSQAACRGFRSSVETKPPFVVRHVDSSKPFGEQTPLKQHTQKSRKKVNFTGYDYPLKRASSLDSIAADMKILRDQEEWNARRRELLSPYSDRSGNILSGHSNQGDSNFEKKNPYVHYHHRPPSPHLNYYLQHRLCCSPHLTWEKIHERVRDLLTSRKARQRLYLGVTDSEVDEILGRRTPYLRSSQLHESLGSKYF